MVDTLRSVVKSHDDWLFEFISSPPQTNEIARSAALLPGFMSIAAQTGLPLALREIGSSAGLNLFPDHYRYRYGDVSWGDQTFPSELAPAMRGAVPNLSGQLAITSRRGNDLAPIDLKSLDDQCRLRAYVWADQSERQQRLDAAIKVAQVGTFSMQSGDAAVFVEQELGTRKTGEVFVLFHSVVWQYLPQDTKNRITAAMHSAGRTASVEAPVAWLSMEGRDGQDPLHASINLTLWPAGETQSLGLSDFHGRWLDLVTS